MLWSRSNRGVEIFPHDVDLVVQIDHHDIRYAAGSPRVTADACMAVGGELVLHIPLGRIVGPVDFFLSDSIAAIPEMHSDDGIFCCCV